MLPVQPYHAETYPPSPRFPNFGDNLLDDAVHLGHHIRAKLQHKRETVAPFHIGRLQDSGYVPLHMQAHPSAIPPDQAAGAEEFSIATPQQTAARPKHLPPEGFEVPEAFDPGADSDISEETFSPPGSPGGDPGGGGFMNPMSRVAGQVGGYMAESFKGNVRSTIDIAKGVGQGAALVGGMAVKSMASSASSASQPGSNTRQMMHAASLPISYGGGLLASGAQAAGTKAIDLTKAGGQMALEAAPLILEASANKATQAAALAQSVALATPQVLKGVADVTTTHVVPAAAALGRSASVAARKVGNVAATHVIPAIGSAAGAVGRHGVSLLSSALNSATLNVIDIVNALEELQKEEPRYSTYNALTEGSFQALRDGGGATRRNRNATPPPSGARSRKPDPGESSSSSSSSAPAGGRDAHASTQRTMFQTKDEYSEHFKNKGELVEELYKRPNWQQLISQIHGDDELRKKMGKLTKKNLIDILYKVDSLAMRNVKV